MTGKNKLPSFLCVGVEKCGTTTLYELLKQHPQVGLSSHKETHFFNTNWEKGVSWYQDKFSHLPDNCKAVGEITPAYHRFDEVIPRIKQTLGSDIKIIFMLREPCRRAYSHYLHNLNEHLEGENYIFKTYLKTTPYAPAVKAYQESFGKDNCLVIIFEEDLLQKQQSCVDKVCDFLDIDSCQIEASHSNASFIPVCTDSPNYPTQIEAEGKIFQVPANSFVVFTNRAKTTRVFADIDPQKKSSLTETINNAKREIPALQQAVVFEQTCQNDIEQLEKLLDRDLSLWKQHDATICAEIAPKPVFKPL